MVGKKTVLRPLAQAVPPFPEAWHQRGSSWAPRPLDYVAHSTRWVHGDTESPEKGNSDFYVQVGPLLLFRRRDQLYSQLVNMETSSTFSRNTQGGQKSNNETKTQKLFSALEIVSVITRHYIMPFSKITSRPNLRPFLPFFLPVRHCVSLVTASSARSYPPSSKARLGKQAVSTDFDGSSQEQKKGHLDLAQ